MATEVTDAKTWGYRVMASVPTGGGDHTEQFRIVEAYYNEDGAVVGWCESEPLGESLDELREDLARMAGAIDKPVLNEHELPGWLTETSTQDDNGHREEIACLHGTPVAERWNLGPVRLTGSCEDCVREMEERSRPEMTSFPIPPNRLTPEPPS